MNAAGLFAALAPSTPSTGDRAPLPDADAPEVGDFAEALMASLVASMGVQPIQPQPQPAPAEGEAANDDLAAATPAGASPLPTGWMDAAIGVQQAPLEDIPADASPAPIALNAPQATVEDTAPVQVAVADTVKTKAADALAALLKQAQLDPTQAAPAEAGKAPPAAAATAAATAQPVEKTLATAEQPAPGLQSTPDSEVISLIGAQVAVAPPPPRSEPAPKAHHAKIHTAEAVADIAPEQAVQAAAPQEDDAPSADAGLPKEKGESFEIAAGDLAQEPAVTGPRTDAIVPAEIRAPAAHTASEVKAGPETVAGIAKEIVAKVAAKTTRFDIELNPAGLGKVDVKVQINAAGDLSAILNFENPQAAHELHARASELHAALQQAGFDVGKTALQFTGGGGSGGGNPPFDQSSLWNQQQQSQQQQQQPQGQQTAWARAFVDLADAPQARVPAPNNARRLGGVDVMI